MMVHSFSQHDSWFDDYQAFLSLYGVQGAVGKLTLLKELGPIHLYAGWAHGRSEFASGD
jgi:hypothetical protein